jgi:hypothetical protein
MCAASAVLMQATWRRKAGARFVRESKLRLWSFNVLGAALKHFVERAREKRRERAATLLSTFLRATSEQTEVNKAIKLYVLRVRSLQVSW